MKGRGRSGFGVAVTLLRVSIALVALAGPTVCLASTQSAAAPQSILREARAAYNAGRNADAAAAFEAYLKLMPGELDAKLLYGWSLYRLGRYADADAVFSAVLKAKPQYHDARVGLGYVKLQQNDPVEALAMFKSVLAVNPDSIDALKGVVLAAKRDPRNAELRAPGLEAARKLRTLEPDDLDHVLDVLTLSGKGEARTRGAVAANGKPPRVATRAGVDYLEVAGSDGRFRPLFVKGFNLGAALPGRYPSEFPVDVALFRDWLGKMSEFGTNTIRLYTLLSPAFYQALAEHNRESAKPIWLIQGVWTELPPRHDFSDPGYLDEFHKEIARVIDAVHGNLVLAWRPGHAFGIYETDVSKYLLAYIIGREWEPFAVGDYNAMKAGETPFKGTWFEVGQGRPMEFWVARALDYSANYEATRYNTLHALTFANWPPLDPLQHPTESTRKEENAWRRERGEPYADKLAEAAWEDDAVTLDSTLIKPTPRMGAGLFAAYHIYPNFPDFMNLEPGMASGADAEGPNRYIAYLQALKKYHGKQPVVVAEFGISTSRGTAHLQQLGWNHGGLDEREQGVLVSRMFRNIHDTRYAGGIVFEFMDEWFKGTWSVAPFEIPPENRRLWFNAESPEQSYGVLAARPASLQLRVDASDRDWAGTAPLMASSSGEQGWGKLSDVRVLSDEGYLYLALRTEGRGPIDWSALRFLIGIDTYDEQRGERSLGAGGKFPVSSGVEFLVELAGPGASWMRVTPPYDPYSAEAFRKGTVSPAAPTGKFVPMVMEANRARFARDGTRFPSINYERGKLSFGSQDPSSPLFSTLTDVSIGEANGIIEMRLPWGLLNVTDPSGRRVLHLQKGEETRVTDGFRFYLYATSRGDTVSSRLPEIAGIAPLYRWKSWSNPKYRHEFKHGTEVLKKTMQQLPDYLNDEN